MNRREFMAWCAKAGLSAGVLAAMEEFPILGGGAEAQAVVAGIQPQPQPAPVVSIDLTIKPALKEMADTALEIPPPDFLPQFGRNVDVPKPTIAAVNGVAYAGGFLLAQQCDLVVAAEHARFAVSEVKVGRGSPWAAPLSWLVPPRVALEILLTGDPLDAARAQLVVTFKGDGQIWLDELQSN